MQDKIKSFKNVKTFYVEQLSGFPHDEDRNIKIKNHVTKQILYMEGQKQQQLTQLFFQSKLFNKIQNKILTSYNDDKELDEYFFEDFQVTDIKFEKGMQIIQCSIYYKNNDLEKEKRLSVFYYSLIQLDDCELKRCENCECETEIDTDCQCDCCHQIVQCQFCENDYSQYEIENEEEYLQKEIDELYQQYQQYLKNLVQQKTLLQLKLMKSKFPNLRKEIFYDMFIHDEIINLSIKKIDQ